MLVTNQLVYAGNGSRTSVKAEKVPYQCVTIMSVPESNLYPDTCHLDFNGF